MKNRILLTILWTSVVIGLTAQNIPIDTSTWNIRANAYVLENYRGSDAVYLQGGMMILKDVEFLNGTIEFDLFLKEEPSFPGIYFRGQNNGDAEQFYVRPHQSGNPDANQAAPSIKNITAWQLYFGTRYSFPYEYKFDDWTHIKILVNDRQAQVFLDYSEEPNLSWELFHEPKAGAIALRGGGSSGFHIANVSVSHETPELKNFKPIERKPIEGLVSEWEISDMFPESKLEDLNSVGELIQNRSWQGKIQLEEGTASNISRIQNLFDGTDGNTVFARITIDSRKDELRLFEFGYSDRVVVILNGKPMYWGTNKWRSRDYRYLGTVGLFDAVYLDLKKGENELLMAVSEDFGGWLITGRFKDMKGLKIK